MTDRAADAERLGRDLVRRMGHNQPKNYDVDRMATEAFAAALAERDATITRLQQERDEAITRIAERQSAIDAFIISTYRLMEDGETVRQARDTATREAEAHKSVNDRLLANGIALTRETQALREEVGRLRAERLTDGWDAFRDTFKKRIWDYKVPTDFAIHHVLELLNRHHRFEQAPAQPSADDVQRAREVMADAIIDDENPAWNARTVQVIAAALTAARAQALGWPFTAKLRDDGSRYVTVELFPGFHFILTPQENTDALADAFRQFLALWRAAAREQGRAEIREETAQWLDKRAGLHTPDTADYYHDIADAIRAISIEGDDK